MKLEDVTDDEWRALEKRAATGAFRWVADREIAKDAAQDAFETLVERWDEFGPDHDLKRLGKWVAVVGGRKAIDHARKRGRADFITDEALPMRAKRSHTDLAAMRLVVDELLALLPDHLAVALRSELDDVPGAEVAAALGISAEALRKRRFDARKLLKEMVPDDCDWLISRQYGMY